MFQKKLEVPPILVGSDGSFVGQSKKTVNELRDKYSELMDNLELLDAIVSLPDDRLNHCSRCRTRGTTCDGKQGRACAPCKKSKLSCNLSSTRVPTVKSKGEFTFTCIKTRFLCRYDFYCCSRRVEEARGYGLCSICDFDASSDE